MTKTTAAVNKRLVGAKAIMSYLRSTHDIAITRTTLWSLMQRPDSRKFPATRAVFLNGFRVVADTANIDAWVRVHAFAPLPDRVRDRKARIRTPQPR